MDAPFERYSTGIKPYADANTVDMISCTIETVLSALCPSPTVPNLLLNEDECKMFEIRAHSSLSEGQMHKIFSFFSWACLKVRK